MQILVPHWNHILVGKSPQRNPMIPSIGGREGSGRRGLIPRGKQVGAERRYSQLIVLLSYRRSRVNNSNSSGVRGQSSRSNRDRARSASNFPPVWQFGQ